MKVFCDLDGTLIDSKERHIIVLKKILDDRQLLYSNDIVQSFVAYKIKGNSTFKFLVERLGIDEVYAKLISKEWVDNIENNEWLKYDKLYDDSIVFLDFLKNNDYEIIYVTARKNENGLLGSLNRLNIYEYPSRICIVEPGNAVDEKRKVIKDIASVDDIVVGDTEVDYLCAEGVNCKSYILNRGFRDKEYWNKLGVKSYCSLEEIISRMKE